jgi:hypothetical protein
MSLYVQESEVYDDYESIRQESEEVYLKTKFRQNAAVRCLKYVTYKIAFVEIPLRGLKVTFCHCSEIYFIRYLKINANCYD